MIHKIVSNNYIQELLDDDEVEEIWINGPGKIFIARDGLAELTSCVLNENELTVLIEQLLRNSGRRLDTSHPFVDATLPDGSRLHAVIPDITQKWPAINIRKFGKGYTNIKSLFDKQMFNFEIYQFLLNLVSKTKNILVSGTTGAGKTTFISALLNSLPTNTRVITCEEVFELRLSAGDWVALQTRDPNLDAKGEITLRRLVKEALRMRPERLILGEVRQAEALELLIALNSGMTGMATIHANSAYEAINKLTLLPLLGGPNIHAEFIRRTVGQVIDYVIHLEKQKDGKRVVSEIIEVRDDSKSNNFEINQIYKLTDLDFKKKVAV
jgi:pilus assembly protein CpaF